MEKTNSIFGEAIFGITEFGFVEIEFTEAIFGNARFGLTDFGKLLEPVFRDPNYRLFSVVAFGKIEHENPEIEGIYQRQPTQSGQIVRKLKLYEPTNPRTEKQQAWRGTFADGVQAWQNLTEAEKSVYNKEAEGKKMSGYNLFLSNYLSS